MKTTTLGQVKMKRSFSLGGYKFIKQGVSSIEDVDSDDTFIWCEIPGKSLFIYIADCTLVQAEEKDIVNSRD